MNEIRLLTSEDIPFALEQTVREGWFTSRGTFESYLEHDRDGVFIAWREGRRAGMLTTTRYPASAWIGNLIVPPQLRSRGIGRQLMEHGLRHLQQSGARTIRLDGDPPGLSLYRSLGFVDECESLRYRRRRDRGDEDAVRGVAALVARRDGEVNGYALAEATELGLRIGPCVAGDAQLARGLVQSILNAAASQTVTLGIPEANRPGRELMQSLGFSPAPSCRRMILGERVADGVSECIFAIGGGAIG